MTRPDFSRRSTQAELIDTEPVGFAEFHDCLQDLERINRATFAYRPTLSWLRRMVARLPQTDAPLTLFDIGSGGGDMLRRIARWAGRHGLRMRLTGIDLNPWSKASAERVTPADLPISYETIDIFALTPDRQADFIVSSLFTHHLADAELTRFIRWMEAHARRGWLINDLHRHWIAYDFIKPVVRLFGLNRLVIHDAPVSVARAFTRADWEGLIASSGLVLDEVEIRWHFPFRYTVARRKPA